MADAQTPKGRLESAEQIKVHVDKLAAGARQRYEHDIQTAAQRWATSKFLVEQSFAHLGLLLYAVVALVGMFYAAGYYNEFDIAILDLYETPDFLLGAASSPTVVLVAIVAVAGVLCLLLRAYAAYVKGTAYRQTNDAQRARRFRHQWLGIALGALILPLAVASVAGAIRAQANACGSLDFVRVTLRGDAPSGGTALPTPKRTILLGTTNRFHIFYECKATDNVPPSCQDGGAPFIVATDNVAAIAYDETSQPKEPESDIAAAVRALGGAISGINKNTTIDVGTIDAQLDTKDLADAIGGLADAVGPLAIERGVQGIANEFEELRKAISKPQGTHIVVGHQPIANVPAAPGGETRIVVLNALSPAPAESETTFTVLFRPLSPFTTGADGATIVGSTAAWLERFTAALDECGIERVKVVGHASTKGFGGQRHRNVWSRVFVDAQDRERTEKYMNCGLANLRAIDVSARISGSREGHKVLDDAMSMLSKAEEMNREVRSQIDVDGLVQHAKKIRDYLTGLCSSPAAWTDNGTAVVADIESWRSHDQDWSWLPGAETGPLNRSAHIALEGSDHLRTCPGLLGTTVVPLRIEANAAG